MAIVYQHRRKDTNEVFYIGIGNKESRAYNKYRNNRHWHYIVNKIGYTVEITHQDLIWEEACSIEKYLIAFYGRKDLGLGNLVNRTDGGDGVINRHISEESRKKMRNAQKGLRMGEKNGNYGKKSPRLSEWNKKQDRSGDKNPMYGKGHLITGQNHPRARHIAQYDLLGNFITEYITITEASKKTMISVGNICGACQGRLKTAGKSIWKYIF